MRSVEGGSCLDPGKNVLSPLSIDWALRFWCIFLGQAASFSGSAIGQFVLIWWITDATGSVSALAHAGTAALLPQALCAPFAGVLVDRFDRRAILIIADVVSMLCVTLLICLAMAQRLEVSHVYAAIGVRSSMQAFQAPAAAASTSLLVPYEFLPRAAGLHHVAVGIVTLLAPPAGALALGMLPIHWALAIDIVTGLAGMVPLLVFTIPKAGDRPENPPPLWENFMNGVRFVWNMAGLSLLFGLLAVVVAVSTTAFTLLPLLVKSHFLGGPTEIALMEGIGAAGILGAGLAASAFQPRQLSLYVLLGLGTSCLAFGLVAALPSDMFWLAISLWTMSCIAVVLGEVAFTAFIQIAVPNDMQGRVFSLLNATFALAAPIGLVAAAPLGEMLGVRCIFFTIGVVGGAICLAGLSSRQLRQLSRG